MMRSVLCKGGGAALQTDCANRWPGYCTIRARMMREVAATVSTGLACGEYARHGKLRIAGEESRRR